MIFIYFIIKNCYLNDELGSIFRAFGSEIFTMCFPQCSQSIFYVNVLINPIKLTELHWVKYKSYWNAMKL